MSDILKVNTPVSGYENATRPQPVSGNDINVQNIVDMTKVTRADGKTGNEEKQLGLNYGSNYSTFLELLRTTPNITDILSEFIFQMSGEITKTKQSGSISELANLLTSMNLTQDELLSFIKEQANASGKFNSTFFQAFQKLLENTRSSDLQMEMLNFARIYNDVSSSQSTLKNIQSIMKNITSYMISNYRQPFEELLNKLSDLGKNQGFGQQSEITNMLKREVMPFLGNYIKSTNNMGKVRDLIAMLTLNVAKYENGNLEKLQQSFSKLSDFRDFKSVFFDIGIDDFEKMFKMESETAFSQNFVEILKKGLSGESGWEAKTAFQNIMQAMLINESVYMPLMHFMVPANISGRNMFSEIWIDPNHKEKNEKGQKEECKRLLIKFNIKDIGNFDLIITQKSSGVDLQLFYPESLKQNESSIKKDINSIMEKNGLPLKLFSVNASAKEKTIEEVFPQIYERINTVDVKI